MTYVTSHIPSLYCGLSLKSSKVKAKVKGRYATCYICHVCVLFRKLGTFLVWNMGLVLTTARILFQRNVSRCVFGKPALVYVKLEENPIFVRDSNDIDYGVPIECPNMEGSYISTGKCSNITVAIRLIICPLRRGV